MDIQGIYSIYQKCNYEVCTDTRKIKEGSLFFALSGANFDGNKFAIHALKSGCKYAIVDDESIQGENIIFVKDVLKTLQDLANHHRLKFDIPVLGITGTNGKTTSKELLAVVLEKKFNLLYTLGNLNNHIGVPLTLLKLRSNHDFALIEMGANKPGDIKELCDIADPTHGVITNIGTAHIEGFGSKDGVVKTKSELYHYIIRNEGQLFVNINEPYLLPLTNNYPHVIEYGGKTGVNFKLDETQYELDLSINDLDISTNLFGQYNANNVLTAFVVGDSFEVAKSDMVAALESYKPTNNRSQIKKSKRGNKLILDAYNSNPSSLNLAIDELLSKKGNKAFVLGDMKELGSISKEEHEAIINKLSKSGDLTFLVGPEFCKYNKTQLKSYETVEDLVSSGGLEEIKDFQVLIKGSRGIQLEKVEAFL